MHYKSNTVLEVTGKHNGNRDRCLPSWKGHENKAMIKNLEQHTEE